MRVRDAIELIRGVVDSTGGVWADFGAGDGTFTLALAELLGPHGRIYAVDRDGAALAALARGAGAAGAEVIPVEADFTRSFDLRGLQRGKLDGMLLANALHFVRDAESALSQLAAWLRPAGRVVLIEYDRRPASRWVPYPVPIERLPPLAAAAGLSTPNVMARRPSLFGGSLYVAAANRLDQAHG